MNAIDLIDELTDLARDVADAFSRDGQYNSRSAEKGTDEIACEAKRLVSLIDGCEGCDGSGIRVCDADRSAIVGKDIVAVPDGYTIIERCDSCETYNTDLDAAEAWGEDAKYIRTDSSTVIAKGPKGGAA